MYVCMYGLNTNIAYVCMYVVYVCMYVWFEPKPSMGLCTLAQGGCVCMCVCIDISFLTLANLAWAYAHWLKVGMYVCMYVMYIHIYIYNI